MEEEENEEPFVFEVVAEAEFAVEVRDGGGGGDRECEGLVLPDVGGGVGGERVEDLEVEGLKFGGNGVRGKGEVGEDGEENGVVWETGVGVGKDGLR